MVNSLLYYKSNIVKKILHISRIPDFIANGHESFRFNRRKEKPADDVTKLRMFLVLGSNEMLLHAELRFII